MQLDKRKYNIYLVSAILFVCVLFMAISTYVVIKDVTSSSSAEMLKEQKK